MNFAGPFDSELTHNSPVSLGGDRFSFDSKPGFVQHHASDSHVVVPDAHLLFSGEYTRIGSDLIISGNGQKFVVGNYFKGETRPALTSKDGATLAGHVVDALTGHVHYAQAAATPAASAVIGHIQKLSGSATVIRNGVSIELNIGDAVQKGDVVQTGSNSTLGMTFIDGSAFGMTSNARMVLNEMIFDPNGSSNSSLISLVQGTITFVAGQTAKNGNMRVETPVATMGIRGTAVLVEIGANDGPTKFSVLVEPDGHTGSYNLYDKVTGQLIGTVSQAGQVTFVSSLGIGQPPSAVEQLKTLADQQAEKAIIQQVFQLYFPNYNPDDSNPKLPKFGFSSSGNNLAEILFTTNSNSKQTFLTQVELRFAVTDPVTGVTTYQSKIYYNTKAQFSASSIVSEQAFVSTVESFKISDLVHIDDPDVGNAPFYDIATPFVAGTAVIKSAVSTNPNLTPEFLSQFLHIDQNTGVISFDRLGFNFLGRGESVTFMLEVTAQSGPDVARVIIPITITGDNDIPNGAPTIVVGPVTDITGGVKEDTDVTSAHQIVSDGTITFRDVDLSDGHQASVVFTSSSSGSASNPGANPSLPGFTAGQHIGTFTIGPVVEDENDTINTGTVAWHFKLNENDPTLQSLAEGQTITQVYTITIIDEYGAFVTQDVTITITGTNDAPVLTADAAPLHQAAEIFNSTDSVVEDIVSGTLTFTDKDLTDTHQAVATLGSGPSAVVWSGGTYSGIPAATVAALYTAMSAVGSESNADTNNQGSVTWQFKLPDYLFDFLGHSETLTVTYDVKVADYNNGVATGTYSTQQVTVQITANNDKPVITAITPDGSVQEDTAVATGDLLKATGSVTFADADLTDTHTVQATYVGAVASSGASVSSGLAAALAATALSVPSTALSASTHTFNWDFSLANSLVQYLAAGESVTATYTINVTDNSGVLANNTSAPQTVTVTITGTNDAPVIAADTSGTAGTNVHDLPETNAGLITSGTLAVADADVTNTVAAAVHGVAVSGTGTGGLPLALDNAALKAMFSVDAGNVIDNTHTAGTIHWEFNSGSQAFDFLAKDETLILTYTIRATDSDTSHATGDQTVVIKITGTNDAPTVAAALTLNTSEGDAPVVKDLLEGASDADNGETATLTVSNIRYSIDGGDETSSTPHGITFPDPHTINIDAAGIQHIPAGVIETIEVRYDVTDVHGATVAQTETITITGVNDRPVLAAGTDFTTITEDQTTNPGQSVGSFATGISDPDDNALSGVAITGFTNQNGHWEYSIDDGSSWSSFTIYSSSNGLLLASDDKVRFVPNGENGGTDTLTYVAWDQTSGTHGQVVNTMFPGHTAAFSEFSQTASLTVSEINDAPVLNGDNVSTQEIGDGGVTHPDGTTVVFDVALSDPDEAGSLTVSATAGDGTVSGLSDGTVGAINGDFSNGIIYTPNNTVPNANDMVTLTVSDSHGLSDTLHFVFQQNGTGGAALTGTTGKDIIFSTEGDDTLTGLAGQDNFVFAAASGNDTITDFQSGTDHIVLNGYGDPFAGDFANWLDHEVTDTVNGAVIHLDVANSITLTGVTKATLTANDFIIHPGVGV